jgi:hypothetical protein
MGSKCGIGRQRGTGSNKGCGACTETNGTKWVTPIGKSGGTITQAIGSVFGKTKAKTFANAQPEAP